MRVARLFLFADWPEKYFSGQSEGGISNASGTRSVRVSAQGLSRSCCKLSPMKIPSSRLAAPGSPRMNCNQRRLKIELTMRGKYLIFSITILTVPFLLKNKRCTCVNLCQLIQLRCTQKQNNSKCLTQLELASGKIKTNIGCP